MGQMGSPPYFCPSNLDKNVLPTKKKQFHRKSSERALIWWMNSEKISRLAPLAASTSPKNLAQIAPPDLEVSARP